MEYKTCTEQMIAEHMTRVESSAECLRYKVSQNADAPPQMTEGFKASVAGLGSDEEGYFDLFDKYGTHYTTSVTFGARQGYSALITKSARDTLHATSATSSSSSDAMTFSGSSLTFSVSSLAMLNWAAARRRFWSAVRFALRSIGVILLASIGVILLASPSSADGLAGG